MDSDEEKPSKASSAGKKKQPPAKLASIFVSKKKPAEDPEKELHNISGCIKINIIFHNLFLLYLFLVLD